MEVILNREIESIARKHSSCKFYLFGSFLNEEKNFGDIDILIVYNTQESIKGIRDDFNNINSYEIFHLMFLSNEEEMEIKFVEKVEAQRI